MPMASLYSDRPPRRLLPNACDCAKGDAAPLLTLPLTRNPSAAWLESAGVSLASFPASAEAFRLARWNPPWPSAGGGGPFFPFLFLPLAGGGATGALWMDGLSG